MKAHLSENVVFNNMSFSKGTDVILGEFKLKSLSNMDNDDSLSVWINPGLYRIKVL